MHADAVQIDAVTARAKGKMRLLTLNHLDGRTAAARRARELIDAIEADLGGSDHLSEGSRQLVQRAAVLGVFIEGCEARWLAGDEVELNDYLAAINNQRRVLATIGLERRTRDVTPTLAEYLARRDSERPEDSPDDEPEDVAAEAEAPMGDRPHGGGRHAAGDEADDRETDNGSDE